MKRFYTYIIAFLFIFTANALSLNEAKTLYTNGEYAKALPTFKEHLAKHPKDASLNQWTGVCLYMTGNTSEAFPLLTYAQSKSIPEASRYLAMIAFDQYKFDDAFSHIETYKSAIAKIKSTPHIDFERFQNRVLNASNMLERVEQIQIIDSINVDTENFFKFYKLSKESGTLNTSSILPAKFSTSNNTIVYLPESKSQMVWSVEDSLGKTSLVSSSILTDDIWEEPISLGENLNEGGNANYPFFMPDGITLYFANDGENSIGGYDIFFSRKDDDGFLQPQNVGMPYNSPFNDYMLVIDEITGIGWWATDRNQIEGKVTIYKFIPNDTRVNYPKTTPNLINLAKVNAICDTWKDDVDYNEILNSINASQANNNTDKSHLFSLTLPNGNTYNAISDFTNPIAADAMKEYLDELKRLNDINTEISKLRKEYSNGNKGLSIEILELEKNKLSQHKKLLRLRNIAVSLECQQQNEN